MTGTRYTELTCKQSKLLQKDEVIGEVEIGDIIRKIRVDKDKTLKEFAKSNYISLATLANWELKRVSPQVDILSDLLNANGYELVVRKRD